MHMDPVILVMKHVENGVCGLLRSHCLYYFLVTRGNAQSCLDVGNRLPDNVWFKKEIKTALPIYVEIDKNVNSLHSSWYNYFQ